MSREPLNTPNQFSNPYEESKTESPRFGNIQDRFRDVGAKTRERAEQIRNEASETIDRQRQSAASGLDRMASTIHEKAEHIPGGRKAADMAHTVARGMESTASYLRGHDLADMSEDAMNLCRRYPTQSLISALAIGFLVGRAVRR
jgi:hypothetical protein